MTSKVFEGKKICKYKFGEFSKETAVIIEIIKAREFVIISEIILINNNKNILVIKFRESDLDKLI
jgi:hypothetical protein